MDLSYQSKSRLEMLQKRVKRCVCKYCGQKLHLRRIVFSEFENARIEIFCEHCGRIEFGVEAEIYQSAKYFVDEFDFNLYTDLDRNEQTRQMNVAKICEIMTWGNRNLGILDQNGFLVPIVGNRNILAECAVLGDEDLVDSEEDIDLSTLKEINFDRKGQLL